MQTPKSLNSIMVRDIAGHYAHSRPAPPHTGGKGGMPMKVRERTCGRWQCVGWLRTHRDLHTGRLGRRLMWKKTREANH